MKLRLAAPVMILLMAACGNPSDGNDGIREDIGKFADSYFNYDLERAAQLCTPESRRWLSFMASNISEADLEVLRSQETGAMAEITDIEPGAGDTTATVTIVVTNYMLTDSIGSPGHIADRATFRLPVVRRGDRWLVKMAGPLRSER